MPDSIKNFLNEFLAIRDRSSPTLDESFLEIRLFYIPRFLTMSGRFLGVLVLDFCDFGDFAMISKAASASRREQTLGKDATFMK